MSGRKNYMPDRLITMSEVTSRTQYINCTCSESPTHASLSFGIRALYVHKNCKLHKYGQAELTEKFFELYNMTGKLTGICPTCDTVDMWLAENPEAYIENFIVF